MDKSITIDQVESALQQLGCKPVRSEDKINSLCPCHEDSNPSLSVFIGRDGRVRVKCQTGCCSEKDIEGRIYEALGRSRPDAGDLNSRAEYLSTELADGDRASLAEQLGVTPESLTALGMGWSSKKRSFSFPELDAAGKVVGITYRDRAGEKKAGKGGKRGLTIPSNLHELPRPLLIVEGATDTAACISLGIAAIGVPSAGGTQASTEDLVTLLADEPEVIVVGENDTKSDGRWPGRDGAKKLAGNLTKLLNREVRWAMTPDGVKDIRQWRQQTEDASGDRLVGSLTENGQLAKPKAQRVPTLRPGENPYRYGEDGTFWDKPMPCGTAEVLLSNFTATIEHSVVEDDGVEQARKLAIVATRKGREVRFEIPTERFAGMAWVVDQLGPGAIVYPGQSIKDQLRVAIQMNSGEPPEKVVFTHLGWRQVADQWAYLHAGGGLGVNGPVEGVEVVPPAELQRYVLPDRVASLRDGLQAVLDLTVVGPDKVTMPLIASVFRAILGNAVESIHLVGPTGAFKTELASLIQRFFGAEMDAANLPGSWSSTSNALEAQAFAAKDAVLVIDDLAPGGTTNDVQRLHRDAGRIFRAQGNRSGRGRMRQDGSLRPSKPPRGLILSTGEDLPQGHSVRARVLTIEVAPGDVDMKKLTAAQEAASDGRYAAVTSAFVRWLAGDYEQVRRGLDAKIREKRDQISEGMQHRRTPTAIAGLLVAWDYFLMFAGSVLSEQDVRQLRDRGRTAMLQVAADQAAHLRAADPVRRFLELIQASIASGTAHLAGMDDGEPATPGDWGWRKRASFSEPQGERIGWVDGDGVYLNPVSSYRVATQMVAGGDEQLGIASRTLAKRMKERGILQTTLPDRCTAKRTIGGRRLHVLHLAATLFLTPSPEPGQQGQPGRELAGATENGDHGPGHSPGYVDSIGEPGQEPGQDGVKNAALSPKSRLSRSLRERETQGCAQTLEDKL